MRAVKNRRVKSTEMSLRARLACAGISGWRMYKCPRCYRRPHSLQNYWDAKVRTNVARDQRVDRRLRRAGWMVRRIWEHDLREPGKAISIIKAILGVRIVRKRKS